MGKFRRPQRPRAVESGWETLESRCLLASDPMLLADLGTDGSSNPQGFVSVGDLVYFTADSGTGSSRIWKTDGTTEGTVVVAPAIEYSGPSGLTNVDGTLYFTAVFPGVGRELWKTDGSDVGTELVKDISPGSAGSNAVELTNVGGKLYFFANDGTHGNELWTSDGTVDGTTLVKDLQLGSNSSNVTETDAVGDKLYFVTSDSANGKELWKSDGTEEGTVLVRDLQPGPSGSGPRELTNFAGALVFAAAATSNRIELWTTDGTEWGTTQISTINATGNADVQRITVLGNQVMFVANDGTHGFELWRSDGTPAGTELVLDITAGPGGTSFGEFIVAGNLVYFRTGSNSGSLWRSDGTTEGTFSVVDGIAFFPKWPTAVANELYFAMYGGTSTEDLWKTNGTVEGTHLVRSGTDIAASAIGLDGRLIFAGFGELWTSDGTGLGTQQLKNLNAVKDLSSNARAFTSIGPWTLFAARDAEFGDGLWRTDGTTAGTVFVKEVVPKQTRSTESGLTNVNGQVFFSANDGTHGLELWKSDGTTTGTMMVKDLRPDTDNTYGPSYLTNGNGLAFFSYPYNDPIRGLWRSDGTDEGTYQLREGAVSQVYNLNGELLFISGGDWWRTDGTIEGTELLATGGATSVTLVGDRLFFYRNSAIVSGTELWYIDSLGASHLVKLVTPGTNHSIRGLYNVNGTVYFSAYADGVHQLWKSDGTSEGTVSITTFASPSTQWLFDFQAAGDRVFFSANDGAHGRELWTTDGTPAGTQLVADLHPGTANTLFASMKGVGSKLYFWAKDGVNYYYPLWRVSSDTLVIEKFEVTTNPSFVSELTNIDGSLYFHGIGATGPDPWIVPGVKVVARQLFYNNSAFDGENTAAEAADDGAIATEKVAYLPGSGLSTTASVSSYSRGINGLMIDIANLDGEVTVDNFTFRIGTSNSPDTWALAPAPLELVVRPGAGVGGSDRVTITWADGAIQNTWLQVTVRGNDAAGGYNTNAGLAESDVFYFGSRVGDAFVGGSLAAAVTSAADELGARFNQGVNQPVTSLYDFNRDGIVSAADQLIARNNVGLLLMLDIDESMEALVAQAAAAPPIKKPTGSPADARAALAFALAAGELGGDSADDVDHWWRRPRR